MGLEIESQVQPETLPRLRFEGSYRIRVRTVDLTMAEYLTEPSAHGPFSRFSQGPGQYRVIVLAHRHHSVHMRNPGPLTGGDIVN